MNNLKLAKVAINNIRLFKKAKATNSIRKWAKDTSKKMDDTITETYNASELITSFPQNPDTPLTDTIITTPPATDDIHTIAVNYLTCYKRVYNLALANRKLFSKYDVSVPKNDTDNIASHELKLAKVEALN